MTILATFILALGLASGVILGLVGLVLGALWLDKLLCNWLLGVDPE